MGREVLAQFLFRESQLGRGCLTGLTVIQERNHCSLRDSTVLQAGAQESYLIQLNCAIVPDILKQPLLDFFIYVGNVDRDCELQAFLIYILKMLRDKFGKTDKTWNLTS